jgi:hypothetical protein
VLAILITRQALTMAQQLKAHGAKSKRVKPANESIHTYSSGPLLKTADAAEAIADNLRILARPDREAWLEQRVRDWYDVMGPRTAEVGDTETIKPSLN